MIEPFPEGCPPEGAQPMEGTFYRLANKALDVGEPTDEASWLRPYQTRGTPYYKKPELPEAHGLSLFADLDDLHRALAFSPGMRKKSVAEVTITTNDGDLLHSPIEGGKTHHDWWTAPYDLIPKARVIEAGGA